MKKVVFIAVIMFAGSAHAELDLSSPEFYACRTDNECVLMADPCGFPAGINRKYQNIYGRVSFNAPKGECATPEHYLRDFTVRCDDLTCKPQLRQSQ